MNTLRARVSGGRLLLDQPTSLPDGTELDLAIADPGDDLDDDSRTALHAALARAWGRAREGDLRPAEELIEELESTR